MIEKVFEQLFPSPPLTILTHSIPSVRVTFWKCSHSPTQTTSAVYQDYRIKSKCPSRFQDLVGSITSPTNPCLKSCGLASLRIILCLRKPSSPNPVPPPSSLLINVYLSFKCNVASPLDSSMTFFRVSFLYFSHCVATTWPPVYFLFISYSISLNRAWHTVSVGKRRWVGRWVG